jgi:hypothetical protein
MKLAANDIVKPVVNQYLSSLSHIIDVAQAHCQTSGQSEAELLQCRLAEDMHPLIWQIQMVSEFAARCSARLANIEIPEFPYDETDFTQLKNRISTILAYVNMIDDDALNDGLERIQSVPIGPDKTLEFKGPVYLQHFFLPNFFFHITTTYNILRANEVVLGKFDFVGNMPS